MRAAWLASLMILTLLSSGVRAESPRPGRSKPSAEDTKSLLWSAKVRGYGVVDFEARQMALKKGMEELNVFIEGQQKPPFVWRPTPEYIDRHLVKESHPGEEQELEGSKVKELILTIGITDRDYREMVNQDRVARSDLRMIFLGKVLAGLVAMLGAFAGYFRLEEATKGFYTAWLRLGAVGLVAMVGAGLYWFR